jgi:DNA-binding CsgD family transcriptional regulator
VPAYIVDLDRRVRWQNEAAIELFGDLRGRLDGSVGLDAEDLSKGREAFAQKLNGARHTDLVVTLTRVNGTRMRVAISSVPLKDSDGEMIGSFGLMQVLERAGTWSERRPSLSPRERETLGLLAAGYSTAQMAQEMGIAKETVRNHVKRVLRAIGASSRVEAVAKARQIGLI